MSRETAYSDAEWEAAEQAIRERRGYRPCDHVDPWDIEDECAERRLDADGPFERARDQLNPSTSTGDL